MWLVIYCGRLPTAAPADAHFVRPGTTCSGNFSRRFGLLTLLDFDLVSLSSFFVRAFEFRPELRGFSLKKLV